MTERILEGVSDYYTQKVREHGSGPRAVDWNSRESQYLRFEQLYKVVEPTVDFSVLDYGCGTGEMARFLVEKKCRFSYFGTDISKEMIQEAEKAAGANCSFSTELPDRTFDYVIGSGIFNVKLGFAEDEWKAYILQTLHKFDEHARSGFSFNVLTLYSDVEKRRPDLYYADPLYLFDYCKKNFSRDVALLHDYGLYEFTILVRKDV